VIKRNTACKIPRRGDLAQHARIEEDVVRRAGDLDQCHRDVADANPTILARARTRFTLFMSHNLGPVAIGGDEPIELRAQLGPRGAKPHEQLVVRQQQTPSLASLHAPNGGTVDTTQPTEFLLAEQTPLSQRVDSASSQFAGE
jgi:hypothetical protein